MTRVVLDTNILVSAALNSSGLQAKVLRLVVGNEVVPCVSPAVLAEYHEVMGRSMFQHRAVEAQQLLNLLTTTALLVVPTMSVGAATDPDDNCFLECAEAAGAEYLITGNKRHFPASWKDTKIVDTREFLRESGLSDF